MNFTPKIVALTGSIGAGKSAAAKILAELGAAIVDSDQIARELVQPGSAALQQIVAHFGPKVLGQDGALNRKLLGAIVFANENELLRLEAILHPLIEQARLQKVELAKKLRPPPRLIVCVVPLLFEKNIQLPECAGVITVSAPREICLERILLRDNCTPLEAQQRLDRQFPDAEKKAHADYVIDNSGDEFHLRQQLEALYSELIL